MNVLSTILIFIGVNIDTFIALLFLLKWCSLKKAIASLCLANILLWLAGAVLGKVIALVFPDWIVGFMGFILIGMAFRRSSDETKAKESSFWEIFLLCLSLGGDNLTVFIPWAVKISPEDIALVTLIFALCSALMVVIGKLTISLKPIAFLLERYGQYATRLVYLGAGIYIIISTRLIQHLLRLF